MVRIIETNLIFDGDKNLRDHQSRVVFADSWQNYIDEYLNYNGECVNKFKIDITNSETGVIGNSIPKQCKIENLVYDNLHLSCDIERYSGIKDKKLAYLIR